MNRSCLGVGNVPLGLEVDLGPDIALVDHNLDGAIVLVRMVQSGVDQREVPEQVTAASTTTNTNKKNKLSILGN
jgi:hypothetical protein